MLCNIFGVDFFLVAGPYASVHSDCLVPAWHVKTVSKAEQAALEMDVTSKTLYIDDDLNVSWKKFKDTTMQLTPPPTTPKQKDDKDTKEMVDPDELGEFDDEGETQGVPAPAPRPSYHITINVNMPTLVPYHKEVHISETVKLITKIGQKSVALTRAMTSDEKQMRSARGRAVAAAALAAKGSDLAEGAATFGVSAAMAVRKRYGVDGASDDKKKTGADTKKMLSNAKHLLK